MNDNKKEGYDILKQLYYRPDSEWEYIGENK